MQNLPAGNVDEVLERYGDMLYRLCAVMLGSACDAEDAVQETMLKYMRKAPDFADAEHQKAWLLRVASNQCRDMLRRRKRNEAKAGENFVAPRADTGILDALMTLPEKYRLVLVLHYVEEYGTAEIAKMIGRTPSAVKMRLKTGRELLEEAYRKECTGDE